MLYVQIKMQHLDESRINYMCIAMLYVLRRNNNIYDWLKSWLYLATSDKQKVKYIN